MDLTQFQWKNRLLLIFAPDDNDSLFKKLQSEIITQEAEVKDRDMIVFESLGLGSSRMNRALLDQSKVDSIRRHFSVPQRSFIVILYITTKVIAQNNGLCYSVNYESTIHIRRKNYDTCASR